MLRRIISYSVGLYAAALVASVVRLLVKSLVAKTLGKEALGAYAYYTTVMVLASALLDIGLRRAVAKHVAASKEESLFAPLVSAVMSMFVVAAFLLSGVALLVRGRLDWIYVLVLVGAAPATLFDVACATLRGQFDQKREIAALLIAALVQTACILALVLLVRDPRAPVWGLTLAYVLLGIAIVAYFRRRYRAVWRLPRLPAVFASPEFRLLMGLSAPLWIANLLGFASQQADSLVVKARLGYGALAEYSAAFAFIGLMDQPITVLSRVFLVTFAGGHYGDLDRFKQVTSINLLLFSLLGFGIALVAFPLTPVVFTAAFTLTPALAVILTTTSVFNSVEVVNSSLTIARDYPQANRDAKLIALLVYLPLLFVLTARYGVFGAAWSNVVSWAVYAFAHAVLMRRRLPEHGAHALRTLSLTASLYLCVIAAYWLVGSPWVIVGALPVYLGLGQLLRLWNLLTLPGLALRLLPARAAS